MSPLHVRFQQICTQSSVALRTKHAFLPAEDTCIQRNDLLDESFCKLITVCENILARGNIFFQARIQSNGFSHRICIFFYSASFFSSPSFPCIPYSIHISCYVYPITLFFFVYLFNIFSFLLIVLLWTITLTM